MSKEVPDQYVVLAQVFADDPALRSWFRALPRLPANRRHSELGQIAAKFDRDGRADLARLMVSLNDPVIFGAVAHAVDGLQHRTNE